MDQIELECTKRDVLGKKVRFLRRQGIMPVHLFGHGIESRALQCDGVKLKHVLAEAGRTRLVNLKVHGERKARTVVVRGVQTEAISGESLHVDFYEVKMAENVRIEVPIVLIGEAPALKKKGNTLVHELTALTVECLPGNIPTRIEVDISSLNDADQAVRVKDIKLDMEIHILAEPEQVVARTSARRVEEVVAPVVEEVAETPEAVAAEKEEPEKQEKA